MRRVLPLLQRPLVYRSAIGLYVLIMISLITASVAIGNRDVRSALYLTGSSTWQPHQPQALRALFFDAAVGTNLAPDHFEVHWNTPNAPPLAKGEAGPGYFIHLNIPPIDRLAPEQHDSEQHEVCALAKRDTFPDMRACWEVDLLPPAETLDEALNRAIGTTTSRDPNQHTRHPVLQDDNPASELVLQLGPADGELVRSLPDRIWLRVLERSSGAPVQARIELTRVRGLAQGPLTTSLTTDPLGLASLDLTVLTELELTARLYHLDEELSPEASPREPATFTLRLTTVPAQLSLALPKPYIVAGEPLEGLVHTIRPGAPFMADLFEGTSMIAANAYGTSQSRGGFSLPTPPTDQIGPLARVQVYSSFFNPGDAWDVAHVLVLDDNSSQTLFRTTLALLQHLQELEPNAHWAPLIARLQEPSYRKFQSLDRLRPLLTYALSRLPRDFYAPQPLLNTRQQDRQALQLWKDELQQDLYRMMLLVFGLGLLIVCYFVLLGVRRHRHESRLLAEVELELEGPIHTNRAAKLEDLVTMIQVIIVLATAALFGLGIILVVSYL
ncbi:hypothetical protein DL240_07075 [Lujinxingia litoralis]|uniref:Uncharacterized protein n=1 Tax=Lujinxingia litoralis TaxID=2211119 RepID=A0A328C9T8_9DELT|nr:hypothetical protein [Lujinxingia litoralis]RAL23902.1 hypothetical protein DL240_07075 [Lujinxingia litoralis]